MIFARPPPLALGGCAVLACGALLPWAFAWSAALGALGLWIAWSHSRELPVRAAAITAFALLAFYGYFFSLPVQNKDIPYGETFRWRGAVAEDPVVSENGYRALVRLEGVADAEPQGEWRPVRGLVSLSVEGDQKRIPATGDKAVFRAAIHRPEGFRNPGSLWHELYVTRKGMAGRAYVSDEATAVFAAPERGKAPLDSWRTGVSRAIGEASPGPAGATIRAIALGDRSGIDQKTNELFRNTGTVHLLSVSGLHLGIVLLFSMAFARRVLSRSTWLLLRCPVDGPSRIAALVPVTLYAVVAGLSAATLRALVMTAIVAFSGVMSRRTSAVALLSSTLLILLLVNPLSVTDPGLQLSFAAIVGLFGFAGLKNPGKSDEPTPNPGGFAPAGVLTGIAGSVKDLFGASLAATLMTAPLAAFHFGQGGWAGVLYNCVAVPVSGFVTLPLSLAGVAVHPASPDLAALLWKGAALSMDILFWFMTLWDGGAKFSLPMPFDTVWGVLGTYLLIAAFAWKGGWEGKKPMALAASLVLLAAPAAIGGLWRAVDQKGHLYLLDVENGLAAVLRLPGPKWVLYDAGGIPGSKMDIGRNVVWPALRSLGCDKLDVAVSSHPHPDHLQGMTYAVAEGRPEEVWLPENFRDDSRYLRLTGAATGAGAKIVHVDQEGFERRIGEARVRVFSAAGRGENSRGLIMEVELDGACILLTGDVEAEEQERLLRSGRLDGRFPAVVAPHHGLADSVNSLFYERLAPAQVLVSCGDRKGSPSRELSDILEAKGVKTFSTGVAGALHLRFGASGVEPTVAVR